MRLLKDIYLVAGSMYGSHQNVYAVKGKNSIVLIDSGIGQADYDIIMQNLAYWKLDDAPITQLLLTHAHCEHSGNAYRFGQLGARVAIHEAEAEAIEKGNDGTASYAFMQFGRFRTCHVDNRLKNGSQMEEDGLCIKVIHTPGHSDGSVVYELAMENKIVLFTGDTLLADQLCHRCQLGWSGGVDYNQEKYMNSLLMLSRRKADIVLPGHGEVCMKDGEKLLGGGHLRARLQLATAPALHTGSYLRKGAALWKS